MKYVEMIINEETMEDAINILQSSKGKKVLLAVNDLEDDSDCPSFTLVPKKDCEPLIRNAETIASACDDFVKQLKLFSEKQLDLRNVQPIGIQQTILLK